jgi:hypothetical protein
MSRNFLYLQSACGCGFTPSSGSQGDVRASTAYTASERTTRLLGSFKYFFPWSLPLGTVHLPCSSTVLSKHKLYTYNVHFYTEWPSKENVQTKNMQVGCDWGFTSLPHPPQNVTAVVSKKTQGQKHAQWVVT